MANKVHFGLKNVYYAMLTESDTSAPSWATPKRLAGAVSIDLSHDSADTAFYADNVEYFRLTSNNGYTGSLELADINETALKDIWGFGYDTTNKIVYEDNTAEPKPFALLFQIEGDENEDLYAFYKCYASRPSVASQTIDDGGKQPVTQTLDLVCRSVIDPNGGVMDGKVRAKTDGTTSTTVKAGWFSTVFTSFTAVL